MSDDTVVLAAYERDLADDTELQLLVGELRSVETGSGIDPATEAVLRRWLTSEE